MGVGLRPCVRQGMRRPVADVAPAHHDAPSCSCCDHRPAAVVPFASHQFRCFATTPEWYLGTGAVAPACIGLVADPDGSIVWSGHLFHDSLRKVLETPDPVAAVTELDRLLTGWPEN